MQQDYLNFDLQKDYLNSDYQKVNSYGTQGVSGTGKTEFGGGQTRQTQEQALAANSVFYAAKYIDYAHRTNTISEDDYNKAIKGEKMSDEGDSIFAAFQRGLEINIQRVKSLLGFDLEKDIAANEKYQNIFNSVYYDEDTSQIITNEEADAVEKAVAAESEETNETEETQETEKAQETEEAKEAEKAEEAKKAEETPQAEHESPEHAKAVNDTKAAMRAIFSDLENGDTVDINKHSEITGDAQRVKLYNQFIDDIMTDGVMGRQESGSGENYNLLAHCGIYKEAADKAASLAESKNGRIKIKDANSGREGHLDKVIDHHDENAPFDVTNYMDDKQKKKYEEDKAKNA